eukprot:498377_1
MSFIVTIIPNKVISIYDHCVVFPFYNHHTCYDAQEFNRNLHSKMYEASSHFSIEISEFVDVSEISNLLERYVNRFQPSSNIQIIIDKRRLKKKTDTIYFFELNGINTFTYCQYYFMSLLFNICPQKDKKTKVSCYLFYGLNKYQRMRFYPECLTTIIPRFFKKNNELNCYQNIQKLYDPNYKHGFVIPLYDPQFDREYKKWTKYEHVSVNYCRNVTNDENEKDKKYEYKDIEYHKLNKRSKQCSYKQPLEVGQCPFIDYIVYSLNLFKDMNDNIVANQFNVTFLSKCYDHIISVHQFCLQIDKRMKIKNYICSLVGKCKYKESCLSIQNHSTRTREVKTEEKQQKTVETNVKHTNTATVSEDVLVACLNSLHCYLLHDGEELYRLRRVDNTKNQRFLTQTNPLQFTDDIDEFTEF